MTWKSIFNTLGIAIPKNIESIVLDSRDAKDNTVFIALRSGHDYIEEALNQGSYVISEREYTSDRVFLVKSTEAFLMDLAKLHRARLKGQVIGITGSVGKTSLTQLLRQSLPQGTVGTQGNQNNEIGVPWTLLQAKVDTPYIVVEMGIAKPFDMDVLVEIVKPDIAVITHIGPTHLQDLKTIEGVWLEKKKILRYAKAMVLNQDSIHWPLTGNILWFGRSSDINIKGQEIQIGSKVYAYDPKGIDYRMYAYAAAHGVFEALGISPNFDHVIWPDMRLERIEHPLGGELIVDCYNASFPAYIAAIRYMVKKPSYQIILGEMGGLGDRSVHYHRMLGHVLNYYHVDQVVMYGKAHQATMQTFLGEVLQVSGIEELKAWLNQSVKKGRSILIKGSRHLEMEQLL